MLGIELAVTPVGETSRFAAEMSWFSRKCARERRLLPAETESRGGVRPVETSGNPADVRRQHRTYRRQAMTTPERPPFTLEFWKDENGREPVRLWLKALSPRLRLAAGEAMNLALQHQGIDVCSSGWGRHVAPGVFEFRIQRAPSENTTRRRKKARLGGTRRVLLRVFCHAYGNKIILLFAAYDKALDPSKLRQQSEIDLAKTRLASWQEARKREI